MASRNDHLQAEDLFSAYIDKRATADEQTFVERHVASCADCRAKLHATRSMIAALKAMPLVRAPRSFVLPKEMAKQPKRSVFAWYPTLRLATVTAIAAFAIVFASDMLTIRGGGVSSVTMSAPAPTALQVPAAAPLPQEAPAAAAPTVASQLSLKAAQPTAAPTAMADQPSAALAPAPAAGSAANAQPTGTPESTEDATSLMAQFAPSETLTTTSASDVAQPTEMTEATPMPDGDRYDQAAPESAVPSATHELVQAVDPLRLATIALGGLVVVLIAATLIARRSA